MLRSSWYLHVIFMLSLTNQLGRHVSCEFSYSYEPDIFPVALINLSYTDPTTGKQKLESGEIGRYGLGKLEDVSGIVVHVTSNNRTSHTACDRLDTDHLPREPFIALVKQGHCRDFVKLKHIIDANASGAVVYSYFFDTKLFKVRHEGKIALPYVFISGVKGEAIGAMVDNGTKVMMHIEIASSNGFRYANLNRTSVLFVSISFIILMVISMAWLVFYYVQRFRYIIAKDVLSKRLCSAAKKALDKIPVKTIKPKDCDKDEEQECCAICIEPLKADEVIRILPCKHSFHKVCVDPWLLEKRSCPMCKLDILRYFGLIYSGSQESVLELDDDTNLHRRRSSAVISDIIHIPISRRNSSSQTMPLTRDRGTSPCSFVHLAPNEETEENHCEVIEVSVETGLLQFEAECNREEIPRDSEDVSKETKLSYKRNTDIFLVDEINEIDSDE